MVTYYQALKSTTDALKLDIFSVICLTDVSDCHKCVPGRGRPRLFRVRYVPHIIIAYMDKNTTPAIVGPIEYIAIRIRVCHNSLS